MKRTSLLFASLFLLFLAGSAPAEAGLCALCRRTLEMTSNGGLLKGFFLSVLLIGGVPILLAGTAFFVFYSHRRGSGQSPYRPGMPVRESH